MRTSRIVGRWAATLATLLLVSSGSGFAQDVPEAAKEKTLYSRMGGYDVLAGVVDDFLTQLKNDEAFKRFGGGRSVGSLQRARQLIVDQVCALTGGPCLYIGREMKPSHKGLAITQAEWESSGAKMQNSLVKLKVGEQEQKEFMALIGALQKDIVEQPKKETY